MVLDGSSGIAGEWPELKAYPDFGVLRDAMRIVRKMNREEDIDFVYFGGVRSGTDVAKLIGLGAKAGAIGLTVGMALGGEMVPGGIAFFGDRTEAERADGAASIINAMSAEASIMARCSVTFSMKPSITVLPCSSATGTPRSASAWSSTSSDGSRSSSSAWTTRTRSATATPAPRPSFGPPWSRLCECGPMKTAAPCTWTA